MSASTQYDTIGADYAYVKRLPAITLERTNIHTIVSPFIKGARCLDLACGTGYYSRLLLDWGASSVLGVDISPAMIEAGKSQSASYSNLSFMVADCSQPVKFPGEPFDVVLGVWFLNYASDPEALTAMFRLIDLNLAPGGHFVGIATSPTDDIPALAEAATSPAWKAKYRFTIDYRAPLPDDSGYAIRVAVDTEAGNVEFDAFHLRREVYEKCAREAGLKPEWRGPGMPTGAENKALGVEEGFWDLYKMTPHFGLLVIEKSSVMN